eukprot:2610852-Rhodomonas_salina.2
MLLVKGTCGAGVVAGSFTYQPCTDVSCSSKHEFMLTDTHASGHTSCNRCSDWYPSGSHGRSV